MKAFGWAVLCALPSPLAIALIRAAAVIWWGSWLFFGVACAWVLVAGFELASLTRKAFGARG